MNVNPLRDRLIVHRAAATGAGVSIQQGRL